MALLHTLGKPVVRVWLSALNGRSVLGLACSFCINFSPVFLWLCMFKNAGIIPKGWRPEIHVRWAYDWDNEVFQWHSIPAWIAICLLLSCAWFYIVRRHALYFRSERSSYNNKDQEFEIGLYSDSDTVCSTDELSSIISPRRRTHSLYIAPILIFLTWPVLSIAHWFSTSLTVPKDVLAWVFYVLAHITFPILTAVWLYLFHLPGSLRCFSFALGLQNVAGVCTHMLFPTAAPWFIHMYGPDAAADYDIPGYAAGLTRVDIALGTHVHSKGFHKSPIVFGAVPSLHSAMAVQVCLFLWYFANSKVLRLCGIVFVCIQWWATMYLDHHFRVDLLIGWLYSLSAFACVYPLIRRADNRFLEARRVGDEVKGTTMGMRVFAGFRRLEKLFDPYH